MSQLLEILGRGLLGRLLDAFETQLPSAPGDDADDLARRQPQACTSFDLTVRLGSACLRAGRLGEARRAFERAQSLDGPGHLAALGQACVWDELGRPDLALQHLCAARDGDPDDPAVWFGIGLCHEHLGRTEEATQAYEHALHRSAHLRNAHERLAAVAAQRGAWETACDHYARLAELEPGDLATLLALGALQFQSGQAEAAIETFQRALLVEPECTEDWPEGPREPQDDCQLLQAIAKAEALVEQYPGVTEFRVQLGDLYVKAGNDGGAVAQYRAALELHPGFLEAAVKLGTQHLRRQRYQDAAREFQRAVELNDRLLTAFVGLGVAQQAAQRPAEAKATFELAASLAPNSTLLFSETTRLQFQSLRRRGPQASLCDEACAESEYEQLLLEAIRRHRQALLRQPGFTELHYRHGMLLRQMGGFEAAAQAFAEAARLHPTYAKAQIKLGITCLELGRRDEAYAAFTRALRLDQREAQAHYQLGLLFAQRDRFDLALERFDLALTDRTVADSFRHNLRLALQNIGLIDRVDAGWHSLRELLSLTEPTWCSDRCRPARPTEER